MGHEWADRALSPSRRPAKEKTPAPRRERALVKPLVTKLRASSRTFPGKLCFAAWEG